MIRRRAADHRGMSIIELMVVLAVIGMAAGMAGVYLSAGDTEMRSTLQNLRFDLERARQEAITRNANVTLDFPMDLPPLDCNSDGFVDEKDKCYLLYEERDGSNGYDPEQDVEIGRNTIVPSIRIFRSQWISFTLLRTSDPSWVFLMKTVHNDSCGAQCLATVYYVTVNQVGRISISQKQEFCSTCYD